MATQGPLTWIDYSLKKVTDGTLLLESQTIKAVLLNDTQAITRSFLGGSGNAQYSDLTGELPTADGYTNGGLALSGVVISRPSAHIVRFTSLSLLWTLTGSITWKYTALYVDGATNKDLLMVMNMDTDGAGSVTAIAGPLGIVPSNTGWGEWSQPL